MPDPRIDAVRERPILFSGEMVRAILAGTKTMTRRVVRLTDNGYAKEVGGHRRWHLADPDAIAASPYGQPGDRLWVRERMRVTHVGHVDGRAVGIRVRYEADGADSGVLPYPSRLKGVPQVGKCLAYGGYREASRLTLRVTGVRVERLQAITPDDVLAEGVPMVPRCGCEPCAQQSGWCPADASEQVLAFAALWDSINGKRDGCSWSANPWVWVVSFEREEAKST